MRELEASAPLKDMTTKNSARQDAIQAAVLAAGTPSLEAIAKIAEIFSRVGGAE